MIQIKEEKIAEMMFDIWHESNNLKNPVMVGEYIANKLKEAITVTRCSLQLKEGEVPSFAYWLKHHKYEATKDSNILTRNNNNFVRGKLFKQYRTEYNF